MTAHKLGLVVGAETGFVLRRNPDTVRGADVAFVSSARLPDPLPKTYFPGPPDLAVEVVSPEDRYSEIEEKAEDYIRAGGKLVWVVDPRRRTITVRRPQTNPLVLRETDSPDGADVLPGFRCDVAEAFA